MTTLTWLEAGVIGLVQGVSELFPVSSLGHSVLIPALVGGSWARDLSVSRAESPYLAFIVGLHVATAIALLIFFRRDWVRVIGGFLTSLRDRQVRTPDQAAGLDDHSGDHPGRHRRARRGTPDPGRARSADPGRDLPDRQRRRPLRRRAAPPPTRRTRDGRRRRGCVHPGRVEAGDPRRSAGRRGIRAGWGIGPDPLDGRRQRPRRRCRRDRLRPPSLAATDDPRGVDRQRADPRARRRDQPVRGDDGGGDDPGALARGRGAVFVPAGHPRDPGRRRPEAG